MTEEKKYPLRFALIASTYVGKSVKTVAVRETASFYVVKGDGFETKYKKLAEGDAQGRASEKAWGCQSSHSSYLYQLNSPVVQAVKKQYGRKNLVRKVSNEIAVLLKNENDPRIDEIAKILGIDQD